MRAGRLEGPLWVLPSPALACGSAAPPAGAARTAGLSLPAGLPSFTPEQLGCWLCRAGAELGRMCGDGTWSLLGRSWGPGSVRPPVGASCRRVDSPSCNTSWESGQEHLHMGIHTCVRAHTAHVGPWTDPAPWCCCVVSPLALLVQAMCRVGLNPARPAPPPQQAGWRRQHSRVYMRVHEVLRTHRALCMQGRKRRLQHTR